MTEIICNYRDGGDDRGDYCIYRNEEGECSLKQIEISDADSGWVATCENMMEKWRSEENEELIEEGKRKTPINFRGKEYEV